MTNERVLPDQALVASDQAASRLAPVGFDPSRIEWVDLEMHYASRRALKVCGAVVGSVAYDGTSSKAVAERYVVDTRLPGWRLTRDRFATESAGMRALEQFTLRWLQRMSPAIATEAQRAETAKQGSVHEGAGQRHRPDTGAAPLEQKQ